MLKKAALALLVALSTACVASVHGGGDAGAATPDVAPDVYPALGDAASDLPARDAGANVPPSPPNVMVCPSQPQHLLVLDFRSGWWNGGGGGGYSASFPEGSGPRIDGFAPIILPLITETCPGTRVEYHHVLAEWRLNCVHPQPAGAPLCRGNLGPDVQLGEGDWNAYTQIWILSGSEMDHSDLTVASALFTKIGKATQATCLPVFLGFGDGFIDHANRAAEILGIGPIAATARPMPGFWVYLPDAMEASNMTGAMLGPHILFTGVAALTDVVQHAGNQAIEGDSLIDNPLVEVIAKDNAGRASIGVGRVPATKDLRWGRPFVVDAGMQRFYMADKKPQTLAYLRNVIRYLGSVGCKSEERPIIVP